MVRGGQAATELPAAQDFLEMLIEDPGQQVATLVLSGPEVTTDIFFGSNRPNTQYDGNSLEVDATDWVGHKWSLIKFDIPPTVTKVISAELEVRVFNQGSKSLLHEMQVSWTASSTFSSVGMKGNGRESTDVWNQEVVAEMSGQSNVEILDVTASVKRWQSGEAANLGWIWEPTGGDGVDFYSSTGLAPPRLTIRYDTSETMPSPFGKLPGSDLLRSLFKRPITDLIVCILVVMGTVVYAASTAAKGPAILGILTNLEYGIQLIFLLEYLLRWYSRNCRPDYLTRPQMLLDGLSFGPLLLSSTGAATGNDFALSCLRLVRIFRLQRFLRTRETVSPILGVLGFCGAEGASAFQLQLARTLVTIVTLLFLSASLVYVAEHTTNSQFPDFFAALYFVVVTLTTVGFGDVVPATPEGRAIVSATILVGVTIVPLTLGQLAESLNEEALESGAESDGPPPPEMVREKWSCARCNETWHAQEAAFCWRCGAPLRPPLHAAGDKSALGRLKALLPERLRAWGND